MPLARNWAPRQMDPAVESRLQDSAADAGVPLASRRNTRALATPRHPTAAAPVPAYGEGEALVSRARVRLVAARPRSQWHSTWQLRRALCRCGQHCTHACQQAPNMQNAEKENATAFGK